MDTHLTGIDRPALARYVPNFFPLDRLFGGDGAVEPRVQPPNQPPNQQQQQQRNPPAQLQALPNRAHINPRDAHHANQRLAQLQRAQQRQHAQRQAAQPRIAESDRALNAHAHVHGAMDVRQREMENIRARIQELEQQRDATRERRRRLH
jgi:hypothetical protein